MTNKLLWCPFCSGKPITEKTITDFTIRCNNCRCSIWYRFEEDAVNNWNTRAKSVKYEKLLEWVKEQTRYDHPRYIDEFQSIGIEAKELLKEIEE